MNKLKKIARSFKKKLLAQMQPQPMSATQTSAQPGDIQKALGNLYHDNNPFYKAIDKHVEHGSAVFNAFLTVSNKGDVRIALKGSHPKTRSIEGELRNLSATMSSVLKQKKVFPASTMNVPGRAPWKKNIGYK